MKLNPIFNTDNRKEVTSKLSPAAEYVRELYRSSYKMNEALRYASKFYGADIHKIASELGIRGGKKLNKRRRKNHGYKNQAKF